MTSMYHRYFGMREEPFSLAINPRYLFMSDRHREALAHLLYGVGTGGGFVLLTGEVGTGKTTINRCLLEQLPEHVDLAMVLNPALNAEQLLATVCDELGISYGGGEHSLKALTDKVHTFLLENHQRGRQTVLLIDEAQHLRFEVLEQIRLLTNLETNTRKLLQIILVGQPELAAKLARPELRQLNQRISARCKLRALNLRETQAYIGHRLQVAGLPAGRELFPRRVVKAIYRRSGGIPRLINLLCARMLLGCYGRNQTRVDRALLKLAIAEVFGADQRRRVAFGAWLWGSAALLLCAVLGFGAWQYAPATGLVDRWTRTEPAAAPELTAAVAPEAPEQFLTFDYERALAELAQISGVAGVAATVSCDVLRERGWECLSIQVQTWNQLQEYGRPALLTLITDMRFRVYEVLLSLSQERAGLWRDGSVIELPIAELATRWQGEFTLLWQPPPGFSQPLSEGDRSPVVGWLAREFASLDGQDQPLAEEQFNAPLATRVKYFQRQFGLDDDGVVGVKTLLKLQQVRGQARGLSIAEAG